MYKRYSLCVDDQSYEMIENICNTTGKGRAEVTRELIKKGLASNWVEENADVIANIVRQQMEVILKPHTERLAALSSKTGHMAATAAFLNVQAFQDLVPQERKKDVRDLYDKARKKAVEYMKTKTDDFKQQEIKKDE